MKRSKLMKCNKQFHKVSLEAVMVVLKQEGRGQGTFF